MKSTLMTVNNPLILGISLFGHDSSCSLLNANNGDILYALTEERFSNIKHDGGFPVASITNILERIEEEDLGVITHVGINYDISKNVQQIKHELISALGSELAEVVFDQITRCLVSADFLHPNYYPLNYFSELLTKNGILNSVHEYILGRISWHGNLVLRYRRLMRHLNQLFPGIPVISVAHHQCHAASAFYCSGFHSAALLTIDGQGEHETITLSAAKDTNIVLLQQTIWPNSLGALYMHLAWYLGFDGDDSRYPGFGDEFKVMGMGGYGKPTYLDIFRRIGNVNENGQFEISFGDYIEMLPVEGCMGHSTPVFSKLFYQTVGERRKPTDPLLQRHYDIACSGQFFLEEIVVKIAKKLKKLCPTEKNICVAGGVGLNGLMNMQILEKSGFCNIFVPPASGDDGTSLGAALYIYHHVIGGKRCRKLKNAFLGLDYHEKNIQAELDKYNINYSVPKNIHEKIASLLHAGKIVGRYIGRSEFGPRALGHRSILANPTLDWTKEEVNAKIKQREGFRPFAPACIEDVLEKYFHLQHPSPYMSLICKAGLGIESKIPAVVHRDGTARIQTVNKNDNPDFFEVLCQYDKLADTPVLLNTSFNVNGEAIVETPEDAIESFFFMGIEYLAIGPFIVSSAENLDFKKRGNREELITKRQKRYSERFFSPDRFFWSTEEPVEVALTVMAEQINIYKNAAEERLLLINKLQSRVTYFEFLNKNYSSRKGYYMRFVSLIKNWLGV